MTDTVSLKAIDAALISKYSGIQTRIGGVLTPVRVFMETPSPEDVTDRVFPSISLRLMGFYENAELLSSDSSESEEVGYDDTVFPNERHMRMNPLPYRVVYALDVWNKRSASEGRDLVSSAVIQKTVPKGFIPVTTLDGRTYLADLFWNGSPLCQESSDGDELVYHTSMTLSVNAYLSQVPETDIVPEKVAMKIQWDVFKEETVVRDGETVMSGKHHKDLTITVDGTTVEGI